MKHILFLISYLVYLTAAHAQHTNHSLIVQEKRAEWIQNTMLDLKKIKPGSEHPKAGLRTVQLGETYRLSVRVKKEGWIDLPGENWIYIVTTSAHDTPEVGDISLAIDNRQNIYMNNGHVCGGIIHFEARQLKELKTSGDFFRHFVCDTDYEAWEKVSRKIFTP